MTKNMLIEHVVFSWHIFLHHFMKYFFFFSRYYCDKGNNYFKTNVTDFGLKEKKKDFKVSRKMIYGKMA